MATCCGRRRTLLSAVGRGVPAAAATRYEPEKRSDPKGLFRGANGGRRGDDGWPGSRARRSASVHGNILGADERPGGEVVGRNRPGEDVGGAGVLYASFQ